jgi:hypothetical protein
MRNLLRSLVLAVFLVPALTGVPSAKALAAPSSLESCPDWEGVCSNNPDWSCTRSIECGGGTCLC